jgi:hypothetical protein
MDWYCRNNNLSIKFSYFLPIKVVDDTTKRRKIMSSTEAITSSAKAVCDILKNAQDKTLDQAKKQMELSVALSVGKESGKGSQADFVA